MPKAGGQAPCGQPCPAAQSVYKPTILAGKFFLRLLEDVEAGQLRLQQCISIALVSLMGKNQYFLILFYFFGPSMAVLGVRSGFKMILSHRAPSSLNMSSYGTI